MPWTKQEMCQEVVSLIGNEHATVNLGIGLPTLIAGEIKKDSKIVLQSENGVMFVGPSPLKDEASPTLINAGKETISTLPGASFFDSSLSFGMIRGGHIDYCVLGGMEVDCQRNLANWMIPGKKITGMGGAMDLVNGAKNVVIMMTHFNKKNESKLKDLCSLPLTGCAVVDLVVTDLGIFKPTGKSFDIIKLCPGVTEVDLNLPESN
jgi:3-oxoacid CoA-transferase subunit B